MTKEEFREKMKSFGWEDEDIDRKLAMYEKWKQICEEKGWEVEPLEQLLHHPALD